MAANVSYNKNVYVSNTNNYRKWNNNSGNWNKNNNLVYSPPNA
jgi:hypothetical protein